MPDRVPINPPNIMSDSISGSNSTSTDASKADVGNASEAPALRYSPRITVAAVVEHDGRFLIIEEWVNGIAVLNQPAGHIDPGESLIEALLRETLEESGCEIEPLHLINIYHTDAERPSDTKLRFNFAARLLKQHDDAELDTGIIAAHWLSREQIQQQSKRLRSVVVSQCIDDYRNGEQLPLSVLRNVRT